MSGRDNVRGGYCPGGILSGGEFVHQPDFEKDKFWAFMGQNLQKKGSHIGFLTFWWA